MSERNALLEQIQKGKRLKKVETNDRSSPLVDSKASVGGGRNNGGGGGTASSGTASSGAASGGAAAPIGAMLAGHPLFSGGIPKLKPSGGMRSKPTSQESLDTVKPATAVATISNVANIGAVPMAVSASGLQPPPPPPPPMRKTSSGVAVGVPPPPVRAAYPGVPVIMNNNKGPPPPPPGRSIPPVAQVPSPPARPTPVAEVPNPPARPTTAQMRRPPATPPAPAASSPSPSISSSNSSEQQQQQQRSDRMSQFVFRKDLPVPRTINISSLASFEYISGAKEAFQEKWFTTPTIVKSTSSQRLRAPPPPPPARSNSNVAMSTSSPVTSSTTMSRGAPPAPPTRGNPTPTAPIPSDPSQLQSLHNEISLLSDILSTQLNVSMAKHDFQRCMEIQAKTDLVKSLLGQVKLGQDVTAKYLEVRADVMKFVNQ